MQRAERLPEIDILRGIGLLGILLVNAYAFNWTVLGSFSRTSNGAFDIAADFLTQWLFTGKFVLIFSFLLGWGIHTQAASAEPFRRHYLRRLLGLFLLGIAHGLLFFSGDILATYAILGLFMLRPIRREWQVRKLVRSAVVLALIEAMFIALMLGLFIVFNDASGSDDSWSSWVAGHYGQGSFGDVVRARAFELAIFVPAQIILIGPLLIAAFRLGLAAARTYAEAGLASAQPIARKVLRWLLVPALLLSALTAWLSVSTVEPVRSQAQLVATLLAPMLTLVYLALTVEVLPRLSGTRLADWLAAAGRMSLTGYVGQSALMSVIFSGYGLGLTGKIGAAMLIPVSLAVYAVMVVFSMIWLSRFRIGPLEWLLRSLTAWQLGGTRREVPTT